jgi:hypothetical protein
MGIRLIVAVVLGGALALSSCGSDDGSGSGGNGGGDGPTITTVAWETTPDCTPGQGSNYVVTVTATDPDTAPDDLIYNGSVFGCSGPINAAVSTISCPNAAPYQGMVIVEDPDANRSTPVAFDINVCETASCTTDPDTCTR